MPNSAVALANLSHPATPVTVPRPRLYTLLDELRAHPVLWIGGPPGIGKTTLVSSYLAERQLPGVWYRVDRDDNDPESLLHYLGLAQAGPIAHPGKNAHHLRAIEPASPARAGRRLMRELYQRIPEHGVLVLDDCHEVTHDALLHALLVDSVSEIPAGVNIILISRSEPPNLYTRLVAGGTLGVLDARALKLTTDETRAMASRVSNDLRLADSLHSLCDGWAAGVAATLERLRAAGTNAMQVEPEMRRAVYSYFAGEVFDRATSEERQILVSTALAPRFSAMQARALSASANCQALMTRLADQRLFVRVVPGSDPTYEYEPQFREFLLSRLDDTLSEVAKRALSSRAAAVLETSGDPEASADLCARTQNWEALAQLIATQALPLLAQGREPVFRRWVSMIPETIVADDPWLTYWAASAANATNPGRARALLEGAWSRFAASADVTGQALAAAAIIDTYQFDWSSFEPAAIWIKRLETLFAADAQFTSPLMELHILATLLSASARAPLTPKLMAHSINRMRVLLELDLDIVHRLLAGRSLIIGHCSLHDAASSQEMARRVRAMLREIAAPPALRMAALNAAAYGLAIDGAFDDVEEVLREAGSLAGDRSSATPDPLQFTSRLKLALARRDSTILADFGGNLQSTSDGNKHLGASMLAFVAAGQAGLHGDLATAVKQWQTAVAMADAAQVRDLQWNSRLLLAIGLAAQDDWAGGGSVLADARGLAGFTCADRLPSDYLLVAAYLALHRHDEEACRRHLTSAFVRPADAGCASLVLALFPGPMAELCREALAAGIHADIVRELVDRYRLTSPAQTDRDWPRRFRVTVLGRFQVLKDNGPLRFSRRMQRKPLELLQALIAFGGTDVGAGTLTDALWPDSDGDAGYHALESALYRLRQLLGVPSAVTMTGGKLTLDRQQFWVDLWTFERELHGTPEREASPAARFARLRQLYQGHFLDQESDKPWALSRRDALRDKFVRSIRDLARTYETRRQWQEAAQLYQAGIDLDGLAEDLYRGLMVCHRELGDDVEALQAYRRCRDLLIRMLGVQPNAKTQAIYQSVRQNLVADVR